jgi:ferric-dicitrate binding protein FerR (iron transport regulator)
VGEFTEHPPIKGELEMAYENDPNPNRLDPPRTSYTRGGNSAPLVAAALAAAVVLVMALAFWPRGETPRVTENAPRPEQTVPTKPATPPAAKPEQPPVPTTPN